MSVCEALDLEALREDAAAGGADALFQLGTAYQTGDGVAFDLGVAARHFELAAERGHAGAQYQLALLTLAGLGVEQDAAEAYRWLSLAAAGDDEIGLLAETLRDHVAHSLDEQELIEAKAQVVAFQATKGPAELPIVHALASKSEPAQDLLGTLTDALSLMGCGEARVAETDTGIAVTGFVPEGAGSAALDDAVEGLRAQQRIALDLVELEPTLCDVIDLIDAGRPRLENLDGPVLRDASGAEKTVFQDGDDLIVELPAQPDDRYIWVDYFVHEGDVVHMLPTATTPDNFVSAGEHLILGEGDGNSWQISPPFGRDLVVVLATARPLYEPGRSEFEDSSSYLQFLRQRLNGALPDDPIAVGYQLVQTVGRQ